MEAIRNYLETMFLNLPNTPEVYKAKSELLQMMEDKYTELKEAGKSENEAVGTVIAEFGNLDELAENLGIAEFVQTSNPIPDGKSLSLEDVKHYLADHAKHAYRTSLGIMLCILSVCGPIFIEAFAASGALNARVSDSLGGASLFLIVAVGVGLLVYSGITIGRWNCLKQEHYVTDFATTEYIHRELEAYKNTHALFLTIGIILCILSVLPPIVLDSLSDYSSFWFDCSGGFTILFVAIGVFLIVMTSMKTGSYNALLRLNQQDTVGGNYVPNQQGETQYITPGVTAVMSVFWPTVTCLYLIWSFLSCDWWITWIIWPIAGIIHSLVKSTLKK